MAGVYAAQEGLEDALGANELTPSDATEAMSQAASDIRGVAEEYREGANNIEEGFGHSTAQSDEMNEKADDLDGYADELENLTFDDADEYEELEAEAGELPHLGEDEVRLGEIEERQEEIRDAMRAEAEEAIGVECLIIVEEITHAY